MSLQSRWFRNNLRLQRCLEVDALHVKTGDCGEHVALIQGALNLIERVDIGRDEQEREYYGASTAKAILHYKQRRRIINYAYQTSVDNIVGKMTIRALDFEMNAIERNKFCLMLGFGLNAPLPLKGVIIAQSHPLPKKWAAQMAEAFKPGVVVNPVAHQDTTLEQIVASIKYAITESNGGLLILAVGHGITSSDMPNQGGFDMAERAKMRIGGKDSFRNPKTFVDVFYEDKPPSGSTIPFSEKELDERTHPAGWERRLKNNATYKDLCKAFVDGKLAGVVLLTCRVGNSAVFLQKVATQWDTPIIAYRDWMIYQGGFPRKRVRAILQKDVGRDKTPNPGTNTPFAEVMFPLSRTEMIVVRPNAGP